MRRKEKTYEENLADYEALKAQIEQLEGTDEAATADYRTLLLRKSILEKKLATENTRQYQRILYSISPSNTLRASISFSTILKFFQDYSKYCSESDREHAFLLLNNRVRLDTDQFSANLVFSAEPLPALNTARAMAEPFTGLRNAPSHITMEELGDLCQQAGAFQPLYQQIRDASVRMVTTNQAVPFSVPCAFNLTQRVSKKKDDYEISFDRLYAIGMLTCASKKK